MWVDRWVEAFAERGDPPRRVIDIVTKWLAERRTFEAFKVALEVLQFAGTRADLDILDAADFPSAGEIVPVLQADIEFAVKRRSLI
jgi:hypothetical protein